MCLVMEYAAWARNVARRFARNRRLRAWEEDLISEAYLGLIDAARRFEPARGQRFKTYARPRILGQMLDWLRENDHLSRRHRARVEAGALPAIRNVRLDPKLLVVRPHDDFERVDRRDLLRVARSCLGRRERLIVVLYYFEEFTMGEIGRHLGLSEFRVFQIIHQSLTEMRLRVRTRRLPSQARAKA